MSDFPPNIDKFSIELKRRIEQKTGPGVSSEKLLLDSFKYFDLNGTGLADLKSFIQVMKIRVGITSQTESDLAVIFSVYSNDQSTINYRELISKLFDSQMNLSLKEPSITKDQNSLIHDKTELIVAEDIIRKNIEYIIYKLRSFKLGSFFNLFKELKTAQISENEISPSAFTMVLKKLGVEISSDEIQRIFFFVAAEKQFMSIERFIILLVRNFKSNRNTSVNSSFEKFDYMSSGSVSLQLVKELFNGRNTFSVKEGRLSSEEMTQQFSELIDNFSKFNNNSFVVEFKQFSRLFSFISAYFKEDKEFLHFIENCFKYSELPRPQNSIDKSNKQNLVLPDELSIRTCQLEDIFKVLIDQLNQKGNKGYISFYKSLKCNDFDSDGFIFEKEFEKSVNEVRITFNQKQITKLFDKIAVQKQKLDYNNLMKSLVPQFSSEQTAIIQQVWEALADNKKSDVSFDKIVNSFHARFHPDFKNGHKPDYEIRSEFVDSFQTFLNLTTGTHLKVNEDSLIRFFEFFGRNWTLSYLQSVIEFAFKIKPNGSLKSSLNTPYGTIQDNEAVSTHSKSKRGLKEDVQVSEKPGASIQSKFYQEYSKKIGTDQKEQENNNQADFKKKGVEHVVNYPYFTEGKEQVNTKKKALESSLLKSEIIHQNELSNNRAELVQNESANAKSPARSVKYLRNNPSKQVENVNDEIKRNQNHKHLVNSPEDGSIISKNIHFDNKELNQKITDNSNQKNASIQADSTAINDKFLKTLKYLGVIPTFLKMEFEMTSKSDELGFVDFEVFSFVLEKLDIGKTMKHQEIEVLFLSHVSSGNKIHVQNFANKIRGQMTQNREKEMIQIFDRISLGESAITVFQLKNAFLPQKFKFHIYKTLSESKEMFFQLIDLFETLNLKIKGKENLDLDDFLYLCDNFSFFISSEEEFIKQMNQSFK